MGLIAGAALIVDYILNVAVGITELSMTTDWPETGFETITPTERPY